MQATKHKSPPLGFSSVSATPTQRVKSGPTLSGTAVSQHPSVRVPTALNRTQKALHDVSHDGFAVLQRMADGYVERTGRPHPQPLSDPNVIQRAPALIGMVQDDMIAEPQDVRKVFNGATGEWLQALWDDHVTPGGPNKVAADHQREFLLFAAAVRRGVNDNNRGRVLYRRMVGERIDDKGGAQLAQWLEKHATDTEGECMYVRVGNEIRAGSITSQQRIYHPNLFGEDPDATAAGTLAYDEDTRTLIVSAESGHFQMALSTPTVDWFSDRLGTGYVVNGEAFVDPDQASVGST